MARELPILPRHYIESLIARGRKVLIVDGFVLKADAWIQHHPGGEKPILHMIGRDATDEVFALHSAQTCLFLQKFRIGRIDGRWENFLPPIQAGRLPTQALLDEVAGEVASGASRSASIHFSQASKHNGSDAVGQQPPHALALLEPPSSTVEPGCARSSQLPDSPTEHFDAFELKRDLEKYPSLDSITQRNIVQKYRSLNRRIRNAGLYQCNYTAYRAEVLRYLVLFLVSMLLLKLRWYGLSGAFIGMFWHQLVFTAHDAGHMGITHNFHVDTVIGIVIADFLGGLSLGWWKRNHNVHHIVTNSPEHDPDIEHMPFFAISSKFFESLYSTYYERFMEYNWLAKITIRCQHYLYYPLLTLGRFNLYVHSWTFLLLGLGPRRGPAWWHRWLEIAGQVFFWTWYGYGIVYRSIPSFYGRLAFVLVSHMITGPLHVQITLSHFAMSTTDLGVHESFPQKMLRTTMDVHCPEWLDFFHGGLQFQAIHHLYPRIPRHNLRMAQKMVQEFCIDVGIPYTIYGFAQGNKEVIGRLGEIGRQASMMAECQNAATRRPSI